MYAVAQASGRKNAPIPRPTVAYNGLIAVTLNVAVSTLLSLAICSTAPDATIPEDYLGGRAVQA